MKKFVQEFKEFLNRGNMIDMAVGVVIATAFGAIINALVNNIIMPLIGVIIGGIDFSALKVVLGSGENAPVLEYGLFINAIINFFIIALCVFLVLKAIMKLKKKKEEVPAEPERVCPYCKQVVDKDATRCPHCTSVLEEEKAE